MAFVAACKGCSKQLKFRQAASSFSPVGVAAPPAPLLPLPPPTAPSVSAAELIRIRVTLGDEDEGRGGDVGVGVGDGSQMDEVALSGRGTCGMGSCRTLDNSATASGDPDSSLLQTDHKEKETIVVLSHCYRLSP